MPETTVPVGLTVSGTLFFMGLHPHTTRPRFAARDVMALAQQHGLGGVELPANMLENEDLRSLAAYATDHGLSVTVDTGGYAPDTLARVVEMGAQVGARTVRTVVGGAHIGGDRRPLAGGSWQPFLADVRSGLQAATEVAERHGVSLAVENHQDLSSEELIWLCESIGSDHFGITLDTANPLATAEEPLDFVRRVAAYVKNAHLKDYRVYYSEEGYRLVRCPVGHGLTNFPAMLAILASSVPAVGMAIEIGALEARHIRVFADDFWPDYPERTSAQLAAALGVVNANACSGDWRTPFERGEPPEAVATYERHQLLQSIAYVRALHADRHFDGFAPDASARLSAASSKNKGGS